MPNTFYSVARGIYLVAIWLKPTWYSRVGRIRPCSVVRGEDTPPPNNVRLGQQPPS